MHDSAIAMLDAAYHAVLHAAEGGFHPAGTGNRTASPDGGPGQHCAARPEENTP